MEWKIADDRAAGTCRIWHQGVAKTLQGLQPYSGVSRPFAVGDKPAKNPPLTITNATNQPQRVLLYNADDGLRLIPREAKTINPGATLTVGPKPFHMRVVAKGPGLELGLKLNVSSPVRIKSSGGKVRLNRR